MAKTKGDRQEEEGGKDGDGVAPAKEAEATPKPRVQRQPTKAKQPPAAPRPVSGVTHLLAMIALVTFLYCLQTGHWWVVQYGAAGLVGCAAYVYGLSWLEATGDDDDLDMHALSSHTAPTA